MALRRSAEKAMLAGGWSPGMAASYFRKFPPLTTAGAVRNAQALMSTGSAAEATAAARAAWAMGSMAPDEEAALLSQFGGVLTPADHDRRMDMLLWAGATSSAARQLPYTSPANRNLFTARLAFRTNAPEAAQLAYATIAGGDTDAGLPRRQGDVAEDQWRERHGAVAAGQSRRR